LTPADVEARHSAEILAGTLVRRIEKRYLDVHAAHWQKNLSASQPRFTTLRKQLPEPLPANWSVVDLDDTQVEVTLHDSCAFKVDSYRALPVKSAGQLPSGFELEELYNARF